MKITGHSLYYVPTRYGTVIIFGPPEALIGPLPLLCFQRDENWPQFKDRLFKVDSVRVFAGNTLIEPDPSVSMLIWAKRNNCHLLDAIGLDVSAPPQRSAQGRGSC